MRLAKPALAFAVLLAGCSQQQASEPHPCRSVVFEGSSFTDCVAEPGRHAVRLALAGPDGRPLRRLALLSEGRKPSDPPIAFAMNGGMFDEEGEPIGLYIQDGREERKLNRRRGAGNFHLLPNGVFSVESDGWHVRATDDYADADPAPLHATQSGPMLVIGGRLHSSIASDGQSRHVRNAVGIDRQRRAHFVISEEPVSFGKLARLFRDRLNCADALYLDGAVSALWDPGLGRLDQAVPLGPLIVVERASRATKPGTRTAD